VSRALPALLVAAALSCPAMAGPASAGAAPATDGGVSWSWLPPDPLFRIPIADTRAPQSHVTLRKDYANGVGELLPFGKAIDAAVAGEFRIGELSVAGWQLQPLISGAAFMVFRSEQELTFDLLAFDGYFGFPVDLRRGIWAGRLQWAHVSAHTADGMRKAEPDPPIPEGAWSREYWQLQGGPSLDWWRVYGGVLMVTHSIHDSGRWDLQAGGSVEGPWRLAPYAALDIKTQQTFEWAFSGAAHVGARLRGERQRLRLALVGYRGLEDTGKLEGREERYLGLALGLDTLGVFAD
jgi:hypothetical protein